MVIKKISRRSFSKKAAAAGLMMSPGIELLSSTLTMKKKAQQLRLIRLGGPVYNDEYNSPGSWIIALKQKGYASALCPVDENASDDLINSPRRYYDNAALIREGFRNRVISITGFTLKNSANWMVYR